MISFIIITIYFSLSNKLISILMKDNFHFLYLVITKEIKFALLFDLYIRNYIKKRFKFSKNIFGINCIRQIKKTNKEKIIKTLSLIDKFLFFKFCFLIFIFNK